MVHQNKKRDFPHYLQADHQQAPKRTTSRSFLSAWFGAELYSPESLSYIETFLRPLVREEAERKVEAHFNQPDSSSCQLHDQTGEEVAGAGSGSGTSVKLKLCFLNNIPSTIFTTNQIQADNDEPLQVALCDITNKFFDNIIVETNTHPLSSALIELVVLDAEFGSAQQPEDQGIHWTVDEFNKSVVTTQRVGERPSLVGNDKTTCLKNGVAFINNLAFTHNSSRTRTKMIRLGVRIKDDHILENYPRIGEAVSNPFRVKDHRGQVNKKHHPPKGEDEVYRLEGIGKDGERHRRLSSEGIETVDDFVKAHQTDHRFLRKLLGKTVSDKKWNEMVKHASEYVPLIPTFDGRFGKSEVMESEHFTKNLQVSDQNIINPTTNGHGFADTLFLGQFQDNHNLIIEDYSPWLPHGEASTSNTHNYEVENTNTCNQYFQGAWTNNPNGWS